MGNISLFIGPGGDIPKHYNVKPNAESENKADGKPKQKPKPSVKYYEFLNNITGIKIDDIFYSRNRSYLKRKLSWLNTEL